MDTINKGVKVSSVLKLVLLIFIPSVLVTVVYIIADFYLRVIPAILLFFLCALVFLFPVELGVIICASKKEFGSYSLKNAFSLHQRIRPFKTLLYGFALFAISGILSLTVAP